MTTERAIELLHRLQDEQFDGIHGDERREALSMAVRALFSQQTVNDSQELVNDCISRKMAIDAFEPEHDTDWYTPQIIEVLEALPPVHPTQTNAQPTQFNALDCVSRQAAIETAVSYIEEWNGAQSKFHRNRITERFLNLPSAQPEIIRCKDCKHWRQQTNYQGAPLSFGFCESDDMWRSLYGETYEVAHVDTDDDFYCGYAERRIDE